MKTTYFSFVLLMSFCSVFCQSKSTLYIFQTNVSGTLFDTKTIDTIKVYSIETIVKTAWEENLDTDDINLSPSNFNWRSDTRKLESYRNLGLNNRKQDNYGRDLPIDMHTEVFQKVYSRSLLDR